MAGLPGTGKSTCADRIANHLRLPVIDKDDVLEHVRLSSIEDEREQGRLSYDLVLSLASRQLENGTDVIVDTCLAFAWLRDKLARLAASHDATLLVVHCICAREIARARIAARSADALPHRDLAEHERLRQTFEDFATPPDLTIDTAADLSGVAARVADAIERAHADASRLHGT